MFSYKKISFFYFYFYFYVSACISVNTTFNIIFSSSTYQGILCYQASYVIDGTPLPLPWSLPCAVNPSLIACHNVVRMMNKIILHYYLKYLPWGSKYHYYLQSSVNKAYQISKKTTFEKYDPNLSGMFSSALAHIHLLYNLCCHQ